MQIAECGQTMMEPWFVHRHRAKHTHLKTAIGLGVYDAHGRVPANSSQMSGTVLFVVFPEFSLSITLSLALINAHHAHHIYLTE